MSDTATVIGGAIIAIGLAFDLFGCVGLVRLPDVYTRLQAATKCVTLGTCLIIIGAVVGTIGTDSFGPMLTKGILCIVFVLVTSPTAAHALARGSYRSGIRPSPSVVDKYADTAVSGGDSAGEGST